MQIQELVDSFTHEKLTAFVRSKSKEAVEKPTHPDLVAKGESLDGRFQVDNKYWVIKSFPKGPHESMIVMSIRVKADNLTARSCRRNQYEFAKYAVDLCNNPLFATNPVRNGIFVFYDRDGNFRLSLVQNLIIERSGTLRQGWNEFKRQTYFVKAREPNRTFVSRMSLSWDSIDDVKNTFSVEALNKEFYDELSIWYFYALNKVRFPEGAGPTFEQRNATGLIRFITRIMFVWFMKQKGLIPELLFDRDEINGLINFRDKTNSTYYKAILQNLFFATLNTEMGSNRSFVEDEPDFHGRRNRHGIQYFYRYKRFFNNPERFIEITKDIPFINGGLFSCLDYDNTRIDCFSTNPVNEDKLCLPDNLLWGDPVESHVNLFTVTKNPRHRDVRVLGLIPILQRYNFTVDESSKTDEIVALDPELLGRVFENLLACFNPETKKTARKQTGSFYTPREIVCYMVEESLIQYLKTEVGQGHDRTEEPIRGLVANSITTDPWLSTSNKQAIVNALRRCKILDPACGSGAFPMGILQTMLRVWDALEPVGSDTAIYARKLELIEKCIYGVDIQPIAVQISKLRCFISLLAEDEVDNLATNRGIEPLPNLEMHFVSADSLVGVKQTELGSNDVSAVKNELSSLRHRWLVAQKRSDKLALQTQYLKKQQELADGLFEGGWYGKGDAEQLARWNPFDQNCSAPVFDRNWMFGLEEGFDIVLGNPPYGAQIPAKQLGELKSQLTDTNNSNSASIFIDFAKNKMIRPGGILAFIVPKSLLFSCGWFSLAKALSRKLVALVDVEKAFDDVLLEQVVFVYVATKERDYYKAQKFIGTDFSTQVNIPLSLVDRFRVLLCDISAQEIPIGLKMLESGVCFAKVSKTERGFPVQSALKESGSMTFVGGRNIGRYVVQGEMGFLDPSDLGSRQKKLHSIRKPKIISQNLVAHIANPLPHLKIASAIDPDGSLMSLDTVNNTQLITDKFELKYLLAVLNSSIASWYAYRFVYAGAIRTMHFDEYYIGKIPLPNVSLGEQRLVVEQVDQILFAKASNPNADVSHWEANIDQLIYQQFGLSGEEISLINAASEVQKHDGLGIALASVNVDQSDADDNSDALD